jgi:hypothetical protein
MIRRLLFALVSPVALLPLLVFFPANTAKAVSTAPLVVEGLGNAAVPLDGTWQFHLGDDPSWASPSLDDSGWESISVDKPWGAQQHFNYTGYAWYRRHINFVPVAGANTQLALTLPVVDSVYTLYWNGREIGAQGKMPPRPVWPYVVADPSFPLGNPGSGVLAIRVWMAPYTSFGTGELGGLTGPPRAGGTGAISAFIEQKNYHWLRNNQYDLLLHFLYGTIALLGFLSWTRNRNQPAVFWMAVFAIAHTAGFFLVGFRLPLSFNFAIGWLQPVLSIEDFSLWFLLLHLLELNTNRRLWRLVQISAVISLAATIADGLLSTADWSGSSGHLIQTSDFVFTVLLTVFEIWPLILIAFAIRKRKQLSTASWMVAIFASLMQMIFVVRVAAEQGSRFTHWTWGDKLVSPLFTVNGNRFTPTILASTLLLIAIVYAVYRYSTEQNERQATLEQEYRSAQELQRVLIPETLPALPGFAVTSAYVPASEVGGDFFQVIPQPDASALIVLGDVSGKGLKAAMTVSLIVGTVRTLVEVMDDPAEILNGLNRRLLGRLKNGFVTCLVLRVDSNGRVTVANAGHLAPFLNAEEMNIPGDLPLGVVPTTHYQNSVAQLEVDDRLTLYTDGLVEARDATGEIFSFTRLKELIATRPDATKASEAAVSFGQEDDITVLTITRLATGVESTISLKAPELVGVEQ